MFVAVAVLVTAFFMAAGPAAATEANVTWSERCETSQLKVMHLHVESHSPVAITVNAHAGNGDFSWTLEPGGHVDHEWQARTIVTGASEVTVSSPDGHLHGELTHHMDYAAHECADQAPPSTLPPGITIPDCPVGTHYSNIPPVGCTGDEGAPPTTEVTRSTPPATAPTEPTSLVPSPSAPPSVASKPRTPGALPATGSGPVVLLLVTFVLLSLGTAFRVLAKRPRV